MLIPPQRHHGSPASSSSPLSQFLLLFLALTIPTCLFAQGDSSPPTPASNNNGILNQYDLLLLTTSSSTSSVQSVLLIDLTQAHQSKLISLPSIPKFLSGGGDGANEDDKNNEDKTTSTSAVNANTNAKSNKGCHRYDHVSGDASRDLIYFSCDKAIGFLRIGDGESGVVHRVEDSGSITELHYFNNTLYWIEDQKKIKSLNTENLDDRPKDIISTQTEKIQGLAVNPSTGVLYFSTWPHYSRTNASIHEYDVASSGERLLQSGLLLPKSVDSDGRGLYWISHPPGIYFTIEMIGLGSNVGEEEEEDKILVMRQAHQHGGSLAVHCGKVYWADVVDKRVWVVDGGNGKSVLVSDQILGEYSGLGFLKIAHGGKEKCDDVQVGPKVTGAEEAMKDVVMIKKMEGTNAEGPKKNSNKETLLEKESYKVQNNGQGVVRLCSRGEAELLNCFGSERFCIVLGFSSVPMCLSRQSQQPSPTNKTLLGTRFPITNNSLNSSAATASQSQPRVQQSSSNFPSSTPTSWPPEVVAVVSVISTVAVIMTIISLFMTLRVRSLSRKPIIRRRVVVSRRASENGTVENNSPASVCEMIDIENCCNMNVCETPCYERTLLQPNSNSTTSSATANSNNNGTTTTTTTTVISVNSSNSGSAWNNNGGSCGGKEDKRCLLSI